MTPTSSVHGEYRPGYAWTCRRCDGIGLVADLDDPTKLVDCPTCSLAHRFGRVFEMVKRNATPAVGALERLASPAVRSQTNYELWEFVPVEEKARCIFVSWDAGEVFRMKMEVEEEVYGPYPAVGA